jgi:hypothetical protein
MQIPAFTSDEILTAESTRSAHLKWVIVVDATIAPGRLANAVACISASVGNAIEGLIGAGGVDGAAVEHAGLPWTGCSVLTATPQQLEELRIKAAATATMFLADMPAIAQSHRVYDDYLIELATLTDPSTLALGIVGPRNAVDRLVKRLSLL